MKNNCVRKELNDRAFILKSLFFQVAMKEPILANQLREDAISLAQQI